MGSLASVSSDNMPLDLWGLVEVGYRDTQNWWPSWDLVSGQCRTVNKPWMGPPASPGGEETILGGSYNSVDVCTLKKKKKKKKDFHACMGAQWSFCFME